MRLQPVGLKRRRHHNVVSTTTRSEIFCAWFSCRCAQEAIDCCAGVENDKVATKTAYTLF